MRIIDISRGLLEAPVYPGTDRAKVEQICEINDSCDWNITKITSSVHISTHADALCHATNSDISIDQMPLECYVGPCNVVTVGEGKIEDEALTSLIPNGCARLVVKGGGKAVFTQNSGSILKQKGITTLVTDNMTVGAFDEDGAVHRGMLNNGLALVENVILDEVEDGEYFLFAPPVKIVGSDGGFVRAILVQGL